MRYKDEGSQNLQGYLFWRRFRIKTSKQTGPKNQSSAWRKGSRTCKPTEAKSTWRQEKTVKLFVVKARNLWIVTLTPRFHTKDAEITVTWLYWHDCIAARGIPTCKCWGRSSSSANNVKTSAKSPCSNSCRELMFYCRWFLFDLYPLEISPRLFRLNELYKTSRTPVFI